MQHINFHRIGRLVSDDRISLKNSWKTHEETLCNSYNWSDRYFIKRWTIRCKQCMKALLPHNGVWFTLFRTSHCRSRLLNYSRFLFQQWKPQKSEPRADESNLDGKTKRKKRTPCRSPDYCVWSPVTILEDISPIFISNVQAESLMDETMKKVQWGFFVYTNTWKGYESLMFCRYCDFTTH